MNALQILKVALQEESEYCKNTSAENAAMLKSLCRRINRIEKEAAAKEDPRKPSSRLLYYIEKLQLLSPLTGEELEDYMNLLAALDKAPTKQD